MKNLIISVSVLLVLIASTVGIRIYLRGVTEDFLSSVERVADDPENERDEFARFSSDFSKKKKNSRVFRARGLYRRRGRKDLLYLRSLRTRLGRGGDTRRACRTFRCDREYIYGSFRVRGYRVLTQKSANS